MTGIMSSTLRASLISLQNTTSLFDQSAVRLGTGRKVNSALDDSSSFFSAQALNNTASDLGLLLNNIGQGIQTIKSAQNGLQGISQLLEMAETLTQQALDERAFVPSQGIRGQILDANPVLYLPLDETSGGAAVNLGSGGAALNSTYQGGVTQGADALYTFAGTNSANFDGTNDRISVPNSPLLNTTNIAERTVELVFNADDVGGRQVLWEEGGGTNALTIYIDNGRVYFNARDAGDFGPFNISAPIQAGQTYHVSAVFSESQGQFRGYVDGEQVGTGTVTRSLSSHTGAIGIGWMNNANYFHDGAASGNGFYFNGRISDVAVYNTALSENELQSHSDAVQVTDSDIKLYNDYQAVLQQINELILDAGYRGVNLLNGDSLKTNFNKPGTSFQTVQGVDASARGLYLDTTSYESESDTRATLTSIRSAIDQVRSISSQMANKIGVLSNREDFIRNTINNNIEGADKLTLADVNEETALSISARTQQGLASSMMGVAARSHIAVLGVFSIGGAASSLTAGNGLFPI